MNLKPLARNLSLTLRRSLSSRQKAAALIASIALLLLVTGGAYTAWVYSAARSLENSVRGVEALDVAAIATGDEEALAEAEALLAEAGRATRRLSSRLGPVRAGSAVIGWVPLVGHQLRGPVLLTRRAEAGLAAARPLVPAAHDLFELQSLVTGGGLLVDENSAEFDRLVSSVETHASTSNESLAAMSRAAAKMDGLGLLGVFRSRERTMERFEAKLTAYGALLDAVPAALRSTRQVAETAQQLVAEIDSLSEEAALGEVSALTARLADDARAASTYVATLHTEVTRTLPRSPFATLTGDLVTVTAAVDSLASGLSGLAGAFHTALDRLARAEGPLLEDGEALRDSLGYLVEEREMLVTSLERTEAGLGSLNMLFESGSADFLPANMLDALNEQSGLLIEAGVLMRDGPELVLDLIAADGTKKYLVLGQTSDELRAAGGFTSSAWTTTFTNAALVSTDYIPILEFDDREVLGQLPPVPEPLSYHMNAGALYLRDVGWDPHFPQVGRLASQLYRLNQGGEVDGVIAVTQWGIVRLIEAVGGVQISSGFVTPEQVVTVIEQRTDAEGTGFLQELFEGLMDAIRADLPQKAQFELARAFMEILTKKDLMIYSQDTQTQERLAAVNWAGEFPLGQSDRLGIVDSNVGWNKSDRSIARSATYRVDLGNPAQPSAELTLSYRHTGVPVGRDCSEQRPPVGWELPYDVARNSCYWNYFRAYVAVGSQLALPPDLPLPVNSVADRLGRQEPGSSTFGHEFDANGDHFAGLLATEPGQGEQFSVYYRLPASVAQAIEGGMVYELRLVAQPGALGRQVTVEIRLPEGHSLKSATHEPRRTTGSTITFEFDLTEDQVLRIETSGPAASSGQVGVRNR